VKVKVAILDLGSFVIGFFFNGKTPQRVTTQPNIRSVKIQTWVIGEQAPRSTLVKVSSQKFNDLMAQF